MRDFLTIERVVYYVGIFLIAVFYYLVKDWIESELIFIAVVLTYLVALRVIGYMLATKNDDTIG